MLQKTKNYVEVTLMIGLILGEFAAVAAAYHGPSEDLAGLALLVFMGTVALLLAPILSRIGKYPRK